MTSAAALAVVAACSWNNPGANPYEGLVAQTPYSYPDIPKAVQDRLSVRMMRHDYDDIVVIGARSIKGSFEYENLREMHFGGNKLCKSVDRSAWDGRLERGLVYCEAEHCLIVPTVCRNVSRVTRVLTTPDHSAELEREFKRRDDEERARLEELQRQAAARRAAARMTVPEPSTFWLAVIGLSWFTTKRR